MRWEEIECTFRVKDKQPELWVTDDASVRKIQMYDTVKGGGHADSAAPAASWFGFCGLQR